MKTDRIFLNVTEMAKTIARLSFAIFENNPSENLGILGIHTGGAVLARRICRFLKNTKGVDVPCGVLDVSLFRDDNKCGADYIDKTSIDFCVADKHIVLVDDVLFTGRTVRAALNAINALGRPKSVKLAVLVDRGHRELPIKPDYVGKNIPTNSGQKVVVRFDETDGYDAVEIL